MTVCSAVVNNGLDSRLISRTSLNIGPLWSTKYWKNTTARLQHKTGETT